MSAVGDDVLPDGPVLVAEDNELNRMVADGLLRILGYSGHFVVDGLEAVQAMRTGNYSIVLMDAHMPHLDGLDATRQIRAETAKENQPYIIALTASVLTEDMERCRLAGMDDFLGKPVTKATLGAALDRAVHALSEARGRSC